MCLETYYGAMLAYNCAGLERNFGKKLSPQAVRETSLELHEAKAISYPLTTRTRIWKERVSDIGSTIKVIETWSPILAEAVRRVDLEYRSTAVWADREADDQDHAIIPLPTADPSGFTTQQASVFAAVAERYIKLFDPRNGGSDARKGVESRRFSWDKTPNAQAMVLGRDLLIFGASYFVRDGSLHVSVRDGVSGDSWLSIPLAAFERYAKLLNGTSVEELLRLNPTLIEHFVSSSNNLVLPGGRGFWASAAGTYTKKKGMRYYEWPENHLPF
jgi:hypothetical protein